MTIAAPNYKDLRWSPEENRWESVKEMIGNDRVTLGPVASHSWLHQPEHIAFQLARYRAAAALIGGVQSVLEVGCGEGIGAGILAKGRIYDGVDIDTEAIQIARQQYRGIDLVFQVLDVLAVDTESAEPWGAGAVVSLDVIEHIPSSRERAFMRFCSTSVGKYGVCVIGTPNARFFDLASPQSQVGHVNNYDHARLHALMSKHFRVVQSFGLQDTSLHLGHPDARHYLLFCGIGPKREA